MGQQQAKISGASVRLNTQDDPIAIRDGEYTYALNATRPGNNSPFRQNMEANSLDTALPAGMMRNGNIVFANGDVCVMLAGQNGVSEIGLVRDGVYTKKAADVKLGFSIEHEIDIAYKTLYNGDRVIYFTDNYNHPRWMNFDNPNFLTTFDVDGCTRINTPDLDLDFMRIFKSYQLPCITVVETPETGNLEAAGYFITGQYANPLTDGLTAWFHLVGPVAIFRNPLSDAYEYIGGSEPEEKTNKAIRIKIAGADTSFTHLNIGIVKVVNGVRSAFKVATLPIGTTEYIYTGIGNTEIPIAIDEVIQPATIYDKCKTIRATNFELLLGNLTGVQDFNFQPYVSQVQVQWQLYKAWSDDKVNSFKNPVFAAYMRTFKQDEVYAAAIQFDMTDGTTTDAYPLIGRELNKKTDGSPFNLTVDQFGNAINPIQWDDTAVAVSDDQLDPTETKRHQIYNTATVEGSISTGSDVGYDQYGEMAFWESTRTYPCDKNIWGANAGKPIRHLKMPDSTVLHIHDGLDDSRAFQERVKVNYLGLRLPNIDSIIASMPASVRTRILRWRLVVADRTYSKSVIASGVMLNARRQNWIYDKDDKDDNRIFPNYPLNDLRPDPYIIDSKKIVDAIPLLGQVYPIPTNDMFHNDFLRDTFFFHSPDTHFKKSFLSATELKINVELYGKTESSYEWVEPYPDFKEKGNDNDRAALSGISIGWYNNFKKVPQNNTRRRLKEASYIPFNSRVSGGNAGLPVWNVFRESSVLLSTTKDIADPTVKDTSRFILNNDDDSSLAPDQQMNCNMRKVTRDASLYYVTLKRFVPDQYGDIHELRFNDTYACKPEGMPNDVVFGGDTCVGQFSMKWQNVFYQNVKQFIDADNGMAGADFRPAETIANTAYYYRNRSVGGTPRKQSRMMCEDNQGRGIFGLFGDGNGTALGYLALMMNGIPNFWVESDLNIELRHPGFTPAESFYRNLNHGSYKITDWLSINNIDRDNVFKVNADYTAENNTKIIRGISPVYDPLTSAANNYNTRVLFSLKSQPEDIYDNWLVFKPLNYYDLPKTRGDLIDIRYLGNYKTLFRMRHGMFMDMVYSSLEATSGQVSLGSGKLFDREPSEVLATDGGVIGTSSQFAFNLTKYGAFMVSADNGSVFLFADGPREISLMGMSGYLADNLPFVLSKQIKGLSEDNPSNPEGIGILTGYNAFKDEWFITKRDYRIIDASSAPRFSSKDGKVLRDGIAISLSNEAVFENISFTLSFTPDPEAAGWISWQSFLPHYYISNGQKFYAGENRLSSIWKYNHETDTCTFFGKKFPFIIEGVTKQDGINTFVNPSVSFITRTIGPVDKSDIITFNKAVLYNLYASTGMLHLIIQDELDLSQLFKQLKATTTYQELALREREGHFNLSDFCDNFLHEGKHFFTTDWDKIKSEYPIDKVVNHVEHDYIGTKDDKGLLRERYLKYRLIFDSRHDVKLLFQFMAAMHRQSVS